MIEKEKVGSDLKVSTTDNESVLFYIISIIF